MTQPPRLGTPAFPPVPLDLSYDAQRARLDIKVAPLQIEGLAVLGHVTVGQTAACTHVLADRKAAAARAIDAFVFGATVTQT